MVVDPPTYVGWGIVVVDSPTYVGWEASRVVGTKTSGNIPLRLTQPMGGGVVVHADQWLTLYTALLGLRAGTDWGNGGLLESSSLERARTSSTTRTEHMKNQIKII